MGAVVNSVVVIITSILGIFVGKMIPESLSQKVMQGIGLVILTLGISGAIQGKNTIVLILSMITGIAIGEGIDIDKRINHAVEKLNNRFNKSESDNGIAQGFLAATMLFCIGSLAIIGSLESGINNDHSLLYTKSVIDGIAAFLLSSTFGVGVAFSTVPLFIYQGSMTLFAQYLAPLLSTAVVLEMSTVGSVLLIGMGLNLLEITDIKLMNFVPAIFLPILFLQFL